MSNYNRRDFLKLLAAVPAAYTLSRLLPESVFRYSTSNTGAPNVILLVFDAMSAYHLSVYGYQRKTTPNLERFARRANVYHAHYSAANFTTPGVASILTGLYPWTHRALHLSGLVARELADHNVFESLGQDYHRFAFSQNVMATNLLEQFRAGINELLPSRSFSELSVLPSKFFKKDPNTAHQTLDNLLFDFVDPPGSLLFGLGQRFYFEQSKKFNRDFPRGIPQPRNYPIVYKLEDLFNGLMDTLNGLAAPHFSARFTLSKNPLYNFYDKYSCTRH